MNFQTDTHPKVRTTQLDVYVELITTSRPPLLPFIDKSITKYQILTRPLDGVSMAIVDSNLLVRRLLDVVEQCRR